MKIIKNLKNRFKTLLWVLRLPQDRIDLATEIMQEIEAEELREDADDRPIKIIQFDERTMTSFDPITPEQFWHHEVDAFGNIRQVSELEQVIQRARKAKENLEKALDREDYLKARTFQNILDGLEIKYNKLKK